VAHPVAGKPPRPATPATLPEQSREELLTSLRELIEALDRRLPQLERMGEAQISADAARLRACAVRRMASLKRQP
jgi:hypothetical protein